MIGKILKPIAITLLVIIGLFVVICLVYEPARKWLIDFLASWSTMNWWK